MPTIYGLQLGSDQNKKAKIYTPRLLDPECSQFTASSLTATLDADNLQPPAWSPPRMLRIYGLQLGLDLNNKKISIWGEFGSSWPDEPRRARNIPFEASFPDAPGHPPK